MKEKKETTAQPPGDSGQEERYKTCRVLAEQVRLLYTNFPSAAVAIAINLLIISVILWNVIPRVAIILWVGCNIAVTLVRYLFVSSYWRRQVPEEEADRWGLYFKIGMGLSGAIFGSSAIFLYPLESIAHQVFLAFVLGGMMAGVVGVFSVVKWAFFFFSLPAITPITIRFFIHGGDIHIAMGLMLMLFFVVMSLAARRT